MALSDPLCFKCGNPKEPHRVGKYSYCLKCSYRFATQSYRKKPYREFSEEKKIKFRCKGKVYQALQSGKLVKMRCEVCSSLTTEAHHPDYSKPLEVKWLCRKHHRELHANQPKIKVIVLPRQEKRPKKREKPVKLFAGYATLAKMRQLWKQEKILRQNFT